MKNDPARPSKGGGYGNPPEEHRWKKGQPSPNPKGRPPGKARDNSLMKMLAKKVWVNGTHGKRVRRPLGDVIDHRLVEKAANGDLGAIKLIKDLERHYEKDRRERPPTREEILQEEIEKQERDRCAAELTQMLIDNLAFREDIVRHDIGKIVDGQVVYSDWVIEAFIATHPGSGLAKRLANSPKRLAEKASNGRRVPGANSD